MNNFDPISFVKARRAQQTADAVGGDFTAFIAQVKALQQTIATLEMTLNTLQNDFNTLENDFNTLKNRYNQHTHGYTYSDTTSHVTTTPN